MTGHGGKAETLTRPVSIGSVRDGGVYVRPKTPLVQTNLFLRIGRVDELFIKAPSERGWEEYRRYLKGAESNPQDIRPLEEPERFERLELTLEAFPGLRQLMARGRELAHYLAVHKLQHERLLGQTAVGIPQARFGVLQWRRLGILRSIETALFQERVAGTTLWQMYDFAILRVRPRWQAFLPGIAGQLSGLLDSGLADHVDWNIQNFVFEEGKGRLFYVDLKPTRLVARESNEHNLRGIRDYFLV